MSQLSKKFQLRQRRKVRVRAKVSGTADRPRLSVYRSPKHIYAQVIDDLSGKTLVSVSSFKKKGAGERADVEKCAELGKTLAARCKEKSINVIVFDKNGYAYHGRIKALADGAREGGLTF